MRSLPTLFLLVVSLSPLPAQRVITTIAGADWLFPGDGRQAVNAPISGTGGMDITTDSKGNLYIADSENFMAMRVGSDGLLNVIAGNGFKFEAGNGGPAVNAALFLPISIAVDSQGNVYVGEYDGSIRKITPSGIIDAIAGTSENGFSGDGGPAISAKISRPYGLAVDSAGNIYLSDLDNNRIRKISTSGIITTIAGNGQTGAGLNNVAATTTPIFAPTRLTVDPSGNLYFTEFPTTDLPRVRKVDTRGVITTVVGGGLNLPIDGAAAAGAAVFPLAVATDSSGNLLFVDVLSQGVFRVDAAGKLKLVAGGSYSAGFRGDGGQALSARFNFQLYPAITVDPSGSIFVGDEVNRRVRKIDVSGKIQTYVGNGQFRFSGNGGPAVSATLSFPTGMAIDNTGTLYLAEQLTNRLRKLTPNGTIDIIAGQGAGGELGDGGPASVAQLSYPSFVTLGPTGDFYFSDSGSCEIRRIDSKGIISAYVGTGSCNFSGDGGLATKAEMRAPAGLAFDSVGELIFSDAGNQRIRAVLTNGSVVTIAGDGTAGFSGDGGDSRRARVNNPQGLRVFNGAVYFADTGNHRVRKIDIATLAMSTVAGTGKADYSGDGGKAVNATLNSPQSLNFDAAGNMYITDLKNYVVRRVDTAGNISTFAGSFTSFDINDGGLATDALIGAPYDIVFDKAGNAIITDAGLNRVRSVLVTPPTSTVSPTSLTFSAQAGATTTEQNITVSGSISDIPFTASISGTADWLQVTPTNGTSPTSIRVTADATKLTAGSYQANIIVATPYAQPASQTIRVTFAVSAPGQPALSASPNALSFSYVRGAASTAKSLSAQNLGGGSISFTASTSTTSGGSWLSVTPQAGTVGAFATSPMSIRANPAGLATGTYSGVVTFNSQTQSVQVPVTMTITDVLQSIVIPQSGLTFYSVEGGGQPIGQNFSIINSGQGQMPYTTKASTIAGGSWPSSFPAIGTSDANDLPPQVRVDADPTGLKAGIYYAQVLVNAPSADNNPGYVGVILDVLSAGSKLAPQFSPTGLVFSAKQAAEPPGAQTVTLQNPGTTSLRFDAAASSEGPSWFTALPLDGNLAPGQPMRIVVQPRSQKLAAGVYRGALTFNFSDGSTGRVTLAMVVAPTSTGSIAHPETDLRSAGSCTPKTLVPVFTQLAQSFSVNAGFPGQVAVKVLDDCGTAMTSGGVIASFSNGDPPLRLISLKDGTWAGTWTPERNASSVTVTADASQPDASLKGKAQITGSLASGESVPIVATGAILNGASYAREAPVAPGSIVTLFGSKLTQGTAITTTTPWPTLLAGSSIIIGGREAPIYFASDGQVSALVPYGLPVNTSHQVIVTKGATISSPQSITLAAAAPGIFARDGSGQGQGIVVDALGKYVDASNPTSAGQVVVMYCTGLGEVTPSVPTGAAASLTQLSRTINPVTLTIGGVSSQVAFAGLAPGFVGLYQVNAVVPSGIAPGSQVPVVLTAAGQSSAPVTIAVK